MSNPFHSLLSFILILILIYFYVVKAKLVSVSVPFWSFRLSFSFLALVFVDTWYRTFLVPSLVWRFCLNGWFTFSSKTAWKGTWRKRGTRDIKEEKGTRYVMLIVIWLLSGWKHSHAQGEMVRVWVEMGKFFSLSLLGFCMSWVVGLSGFWIGDGLALENEG